MHRYREIAAPNSYFPILLLAILVDEVCSGHLIGTFSERSIVQQSIFYISFLLLQIIASPLQAGFSDFYCRKKSLIASLSFSVISLVFSFFYLEGFFSQILVLSIALFMKSCLGNTLPLAWAGIADINNRNYRLSLGLSTSTIAIGYLTLIGIDSFFEKKQAVFVVFVLYIILIPIVAKYFLDLVDRKKVRDLVFTEAYFEKYKKKYYISNFFKLVFAESRNIKERFLKCSKFRIGLFGTFLPLEISFYSSHALGVDFAIKKFKIITISMIIGYICGVLMLKFYEKEDDEAMMYRGYMISISSFLPIFLSSVLFSATELRWIITFFYFIYSFGVAFIVPSLFAILSKEREVHEQGKIYGLIESTDTIALLIALLFGVFYNFINNIVVVCFFSFLMLLMSRLYYARFNKTKRKFI